MPASAAIVLKSSAMTAQGFDRKPNGRLLDQIVEMTSEMGLAYERAIGYEKHDHTHDRHMLVCPRASCRMDVIGPNGAKHTIDSTRALWVPKEKNHSDHGKSAIYDTLALFPSGTYFDLMISENGLVAEDQTFLESHFILFKRTKWLDDILDRYFFERVLNRNSPPGCVYFLEKQILNEVVRIVFRDKHQQAWGEAEKDFDALNIALRFIESNLFHEIDLEQIATAAKVSPSTLSRRFKDALGQKPIEYVTARRLDEALHLLKRGEHQVGDIAMLVGYGDFSAFSRAFKKRFGRSASSI